MMGSGEAQEPGRTDSTRQQGTPSILQLPLTTPETAATFVLSNQSVSNPQSQLLGTDHSEPRAPETHRPVRLDHLATTLGTPLLQCNPLLPTRRARPRAPGPAALARPRSGPNFPPGSPTHDPARPWARGGGPRGCHRLLCPVTAPETEGTGIGQRTTTPSNHLGRIQSFQEDAGK